MFESETQELETIEFMDAIDSQQDMTEKLNTLSIDNKSSDSFSKPEVSEEDRILMEQLLKNWKTEND